MIGNERKRRPVAWYVALAIAAAASIIALTTYDGDEDIYRALSAGAKGYVVKDMLRTELLGIIRQVYAGHRGIPSHVASKLAEFTPRTQLRPRELEILQFLAKGLSNRDIAAIVGRRRVR